MGRYSAFLAFFAQFYSKNAHSLQPLKGGCKFVFLFSSFSLLLPFAALFFLFSSASINLKASKLPTNWGVRHAHIYIYAVELKTGPIFAFSSVKNWSIFFVVFVFLFSKISFSLQNQEDFSKKKKKRKQTKNNISSVKNWSNFVAQHTWTSF